MTATDAHLQRCIERDAQDVAAAWEVHYVMEVWKGSALSCCEDMFTCRILGGRPGMSYLRWWLFGIDRENVREATLEAIHRRYPRG